MGLCSQTISLCLQTPWTQVNYRIGEFLFWYCPNSNSFFSGLELFRIFTGSNNRLTPGWNYSFLQIKYYKTIGAKGFSFKNKQTNKKTHNNIEKENLIQKSNQRATDWTCETWRTIIQEHVSSFPRSVTCCGLKGKLFHSLKSIGSPAC